MNLQQPVIVAFAVACAILIAWLSLARGDARVVARIPAWMSPLGHFVLYGLLGYACTRSLQGVAIAAHLQVLGGALLATGFGAAMEYVQRFRPGRFARVADVLIDGLGATTGALLVLA